MPAVTLTLTCESTSEAQLYLCAPQYYNLISDLHSLIRSSEKYDTKLEDSIKSFYPEICKCVESHLGPY
jgi:hypothetical protein